MEDLRFKRTVVILIAAITFLGALLAFLNVDASMRSSVSSRDARILAISSLPQDMTGLQDALRARDQLALTQELDWMSMVQQLQAYAYAGETGSAPYVPAWQASLELAAARTPSLLESLQAIGPLSPTSNILQLFADSYVTPQAQLQEEQGAQKKSASSWSNKAGAYLIGITILAVVLFLLTLSLTISTRLRFLFTTVGLLLALAVIVYSTVTMLTPLSLPSPQAIQLYAAASGKQYLVDTLYVNNLWDRIPPITDEGLALLDRGLADSPDFPAAWYLRGMMFSLRGQAAIFGQANPDVGRAEMAKATTDIRQAIAQGRDSFDVYLSLGVAQIYGRDYEGSLQSFQKATELAPQQALLLGLDQAFSYLAWGKPQEAMQAVEGAIDFAYRNPLYSDNYYFRKIIYLLERIRPAWTLEGMDTMIKRLKEAYVSLEFLKQPTPTPSGAKIEPLVFFETSTDSRGEPVYTDLDIFPAFTPYVEFSFKYSGIQPGSLVVQKVYLDWNEQFLLKRAEAWPDTLEPDGTADWRVHYPIPETDDYLLPGNYQVELYVEGELLSSGSFTVQPPGE